MASLLHFVDRIRTLQDMPPCRAGITLFDVGPHEENSCILAMSLGAPVGPVGERPGSPEWPWALKVRDRTVARRIGIIMDLPYRFDPPAVQLPDPIIDLALSAAYGHIEVDDNDILRHWWVPMDGEVFDAAERTGDESMNPRERPDRWELLTPQDELLPGGTWARLLNASGFGPRSRY